MDHAQTLKNDIYRILKDVCHLIIWIFFLSPGIYSFSLIFTYNSLLVDGQYISPYQAFIRLFREFMLIETKFFSDVSIAEVPTAFLSSLVVWVLCYNINCTVVIVLVFCFLYVMVGPWIFSSILVILPTPVASIVGSAMVTSFVMAVARG